MPQVIFKFQTLIQQRRSAILVRRAWSLGVERDRLVEIRVATTEADLIEIRALFEEYLAWVCDEQGIDLAYQGSEAELASLPGVYGPPAGCLLLAVAENQAAGCVALRSHGEGVCELKRMYVRPGYRNRGLGRQLGERIIAEARGRGYRLMRLDTADTMTSAHRLYHQLGFRPTQPYYQASPEIMARARFMELSLGAYD